MPVTSTRPQCTKFAMSYYQESAYGTAIAAAKIDKLFEPNEPIVLEINQTRRDDADVIHGNEFPINPDLDIVETQDISIPFNFPCSLEVAGLLYALAMGTPAKSGATPDFIHTMKALDPCEEDSLPSTTWVLGHGSDDDSFFAVKGVVINELKLEISKKGRLDITGTAFTDGTLTASPTFEFPTTSDHAEFLVSAMGDLKVGGDSKQTKIRSLSFTITNNLDLADARSNVITAGIYLSQLRFGARQYQLTLRVDGHPGDEFWALFLPSAEGVTADPVEIDVYLTYTAGHHILHFNFPVMKVDSYKPGFDGLHDVIDLTFKPFYDATDETPVTITMTNGVPEYLTVET